jgi:DNA-binding response OmpR family regulator
MRILIAEDDEALGKFVRQGLEGEQYRVDSAKDGEQALSAALASDYDVVILDLNLPKLDGVGVLRQVRIKKPSLPILILTQRTRVEDRVQALDTGADDYLGKPFSFSELSARIRALIRRSHLPSESVLTVADLKLDRVQRSVERGGLKIELTAKEFSLLEYLMRNAGRDVTRSMIIEHVWNLTFDTTTNVVDVYIFGKWQKIESLRAAVVGLGIQRVSDIAMSCGVLNMMPKDLGGINPLAFWEHSLGCALVCRHFARKISYPHPGKAYLAGLLHDIGIIVNLWVLPNEFHAAFDLARSQGIPLDQAEQQMLGFTHCDAGMFLAQRWRLAQDLSATVSLHHTTYESTEHAALIAVVELSDLLCRMSGLDYGYIENREVNLLNERGFCVLSKRCPELQKLDWARLTFELESYMDEVHALVHAIYRK